MRRYWLNPEARRAFSVEIAGDVFHHIFEVCRQDQGAEFEILFGDGQAHRVRVIEKGKKRAIADIIESRILPELPFPRLHLCLSLPRWPVADAVLEKAVEMGVDTVHIFLSEHSFLRKMSEMSEGRMERWQKIITSATQQTGRGERMKITPVRPLEDLLKEFNQNPDRKGLFLYEGSSVLTARSWFEGLSRENGDPKELWAFIGSEGGFSNREVEAFKKVGLDPLTLGSQVLRVETACLAILSILKYQWNL